MPFRFHGDGSASEGLSQLDLEVTVETAEQNSRVGAFAAMDRHDDRTRCKQSQAFGLIKKTAGQVKGIVVPRGPNAFKGIEIEVLAGDGAGNFRCSALDATPVRSDHRYTRRGTAANQNVKVAAANLVFREISETAIRLGVYRSHHAASFELTGAL